MAAATTASATLPAPSSTDLEAKADGVVALQQYRLCKMVLARVGGRAAGLSGRKLPRPAGTAVMITVCVSLTSERQRLYAAGEPELL